MKKLFLALAFSAFASAAIADEAKTPISAAASGNGWYLSFDAGVLSVGLPDYGLGFHKVSSPTFPDAGPFQVFAPRLDGYILNGTVGYYLPPESSDTVLGANTRLEVGGHYGHASGTDSGSALYTGGGVIGMYLDGSGGNGGYVCADFQNCNANSSLSGDYSNWQLNGRIAGDRPWGNMVVTPSLTFFGGNTHVDQTFSQILQIHTLSETYNATTSLRWREFGVRAGLDMKSEVTPRLTVGFGGWVGFAGRHASFEGNDIGQGTLGIVTGTGAASADGNATPFIANLEANVAYKWLPALTLRGFSGLNFDSKVPGVGAPSFGGTLGSFTGTPGTVSFQSTVSYYAGGGVIWTF